MALHTLHWSGRFSNLALSCKRRLSSVPNLVIWLRKSGDNSKKLFALFSAVHTKEKKCLSFTVTVSDWFPWLRFLLTCCHSHPMAGHVWLAHCIVECFSRTLDKETDTAHQLPGHRDSPAVASYVCSNCMSLLCVLSKIVTQGLKLNCTVSVPCSDILLQIATN